MTKRLIQHISIIGIGLYLLALIVINLAFRAYAMRIEWMLWGIGEVLFFFVLTAVFCRFRKLLLLFQVGLSL